MKEIVMDIVRQLFGWSKPRTGKLVITHYAFTKMSEFGLDVMTLHDAYMYGEEVKPNMIVRKYRNYQVGIIVKPDENRWTDNQFVIVTYWKGITGRKEGEKICATLKI
jgi:hypothetical protein